MADKQYLELVKDVLENGKPTEGFREDRTGVGTYSVFGRQLRFDLKEGFPLLTTKRIHLKSIIYELLWFIKGDTNTKYLTDNGVTIWNEWADPVGNLGPVYGHQWRNYNGVDQIRELINNLKTNPYSRRHIVSAWNVSDLPKMALVPCHAFFQLYVSEGKLSLQLYQRSADLMLGVPFNIASYALLLQMIAQVTGYEAHEFIHTFGDVHIYSNHIEGAKEQLQRDPRPLPRMVINPDVRSIFDFKYQDFKLEGYDPHPTIKLPVAV